jgi:hypothetical protein
MAQLLELEAIEPVRSRDRAAYAQRLADPVGRLSGRALV